MHDDHNSKDELDNELELLDTDPKHRFAANPRIGEEAELMVGLFREMKPGDILTYDKVSIALGREFQSDRSPWYKAQKAVQREHGINVVTEHGIGFRRLTDEDTIRPYHDKSMARMRRESRRNYSRLAVVDYASLDQSQRHELIVARAQTAVAYKTATKAAQKKLAASTGKNTAALPSAKALEYLAKR